MTFNLLMIIISAFIFLTIGLSTFKAIFKTRKMSAKNIYKLIDDLEKKYIY